MGYAVYEDRHAQSLGVERWAGYEVPAECDFPDCGADIDRGVAYLCGDDPMDDNAGEHRGGECTGGRTDLLHESVGTWVGYFDAPDTHTLCAGLLDAFPEAQAWVHVGQERRGRLHGTGEYR